MKNEIKKELELISPKLSSMNLDLGFKVPKNYFEELSDSCIVDVDAMEGGMNVPESYFDDLEGKVMETISSMDQDSGRSRIFSISFVSRIASVAAMGLILIMAIVHFQSEGTQVVGDQLLSSVEEDEVYDFIIDNAQNYSYDELIEVGLITEDLLSEDEWDSSEEDFDLLDEMFDDIDINEFGELL